MMCVTIEKKTIEKEKRDLRAGDHLFMWPPTLPTSRPTTFLSILSLKNMTQTAFLSRTHCQASDHGLVLSSSRPLVLDKPTD